MALDSIVVGAGIVGSSIAWRLAQAGLRVLLLDAGRMGGEASWAGAGMLAPGGEIDQPSAWADFALENLRLYPDFVAELEEEAGLTIDFQRRGAVEIALTEAELQSLRARAAAQAKLGIRSCPMSLEELRRQAPLAQPKAAGAFFYPEDAHVDPRDVLKALRVACASRSVEIQEQMRVEELHPRRDSVEAITADGRVTAATAVIAAGAWSSRIAVAGRQLPRAFPVRGHLAGFQMEPGSVGPILRRDHTYIVQRAGGFTVVGTSSEHCGFDRALDPAAIADISRRASALMPSLAGRRPDESWLGFRPAIEADGPAIGRAGESNVWLAYGHYRNGILMAPATAARVAADITASSGTDSSWPNGRR